MSTETIVQPTRLEIEDLLPFEKSEDPNSRTHIVWPEGNEHIWKPGMTAQDVVDLARMDQIEIVAICGYKFIPKHNPKQHDLCQACANVFRSAG